MRTISRIGFALALAAPAIAAGPGSEVEVPEPVTFALIGGGLTALGLLLRRNARKARRTGGGESPTSPAG